MSDLKAAAIIAAAGHGRRFGGGQKKQFQSLAGKPVIAYSIATLERSPLIEEVILVVPEDSVDYCLGEIVEKFNYRKVNKVIAGGPERQHSVENGFSSLSGKVDVVVVHDGVRPFINSDMIGRVIEEAWKSGGAILALPASDTLKKSSEEGYIESTISRESIWLAQTPQAFRYEVLREAYERAKKGPSLFTDESSLVEEIGVRVKLVKGSPLNIKITTEDDLILGESILREGIFKGD